MFGEYRAPTGVSRAIPMAASASVEIDEVRAEVDRVSNRLGRRIIRRVGVPEIEKRLLEAVEAELAINIGLPS